MRRVAHVSDLHVLSPFGANWRQALFNKRITGYANVLLRRGRVFRPHYLEKVLEQAAERADHVVVTGDITNLALESEYAEARRLLDRIAEKAEVTVAPGNHDIYLPEIGHERHFEQHFAPFMQSDLPELAVEVPAGHFPCVKLRGSVALIALSSAVPRPPFVSSGILGRAQRQALKQVLLHPEVRRRTPWLLVHHDPLDGSSHLEQLRSGLVDAHALRRILATLERGAVLFGHLHVRSKRSFTTYAGDLDVVGASGGSLDHHDDRVRAGLNLYHLGEDGSLARAEAWVIDPDSLELVEKPLRGAP
ncbi:MAG: metallophosphoesterase [Polyangiaceae bacterium]